MDTLSSSSKFTLDTLQCMSDPFACVPRLGCKFGYIFIGSRHHLCAVRRRGTDWRERRVLNE